MGRRIVSRVVATGLAAVVGVALLSGSDQPVTARPYPSWQQLARPPLSPRAHALGVHVGHRVLLLGGRHGRRVRDGASYDLRIGRWRHLRLPIPVTDRDEAVAAAHVVVLRHRRVARPASWWSYDPGADVWSRLRHLPGQLSAPSAFGSEVYALSGRGLAGRRVVVYSVQLDRWTPLPLDPLRPALRGRAVSASRAGTLVTGYAGHGSHPVADRWDGLRWHRSRALPVPVPDRRATAIQVGGRLVVYSSDQAWIHTP